MSLLWFIEPLRRVYKIYITYCFCISNFLCSFLNNISKFVLQLWFHFHYIYACVCNNKHFSPFYLNLLRIFITSTFISVFYNVLTYQLYFIPTPIINTFFYFLSKTLILLKATPFLKITDLFHSFNWDVWRLFLNTFYFYLKYYSTSHHSLRATRSSALSHKNHAIMNFLFFPSLLTLSSVVYSWWMLSQNSVDRP